MPMVEVEPELYERMEDLVERAQRDAPLSVETIVHLAVNAFLEGADGNKEYPWRSD